MKIEVMLWIVVFILVALAFLFPKTRAFSLSAIGVAIVAILFIVVIVVLAKRSEPVAPTAAGRPAAEQKPVDFERFHVENLDKADPEAKSRIRIAEIRFDQVRAVAGTERDSIGKIVARLYNDSATYTLTDYGYDLVVQDCIRSVCTTVFDQHGQSAASVPPGQARDIEISIRSGTARDLPAIKILGTANVLLTAASTRARPAGGQKATD
jgi:hypothetical protein